MKNETNQNFDLPALLRLKGINIKKAAKNNIELFTGDYFKLLSSFIKHAPQIKDSLVKISLLNGDDNDYQLIESKKALSNDIGYEKYVPLAEEIVRVGKRGNSEIAADCAKKILVEFDEVCTQLNAAKKERKPEDLTGVINAENTTYENYETQFLDKALKLMEHEEATRKMRILAIDDAPVILKTIIAVLNDYYTVYGLTNPKMMEKVLKQITPEMFLLDYEMPDLNGFDLIPIIRSFEEHKETPIIFLTSLGTVDHVSAALALGACDFIVKPFQGNILREKIAKYIIKKNLF